MLRAIDGYKGKWRVVQAPFKLLPIVFVRSSELRYARWDEVDLDGVELWIRAERMN